VNALNPLLASGFWARHSHPPAEGTDSRDFAHAAAAAPVRRLTAGAVELGGAVVISAAQLARMRCWREASPPHETPRHEAASIALRLLDDPDGPAEVVQPLDRISNLESVEAELQRRCGWYVATALLGGLSEMCARPLPLHERVLNWVRRRF
jgi:hypothetical protein